MSLKLNSFSWFNFCSNVHASSYYCWDLNVNGPRRGEEWITVLHPSSYQQPPNFCTKAAIDLVVITCMLAHWMKPRYNQPAIFQHLEGASGFFTVLTHSHAEGQSGMNTEWISNVYWHNQSRSPYLSFWDRGYDDVLSQD